MTQNWLAACTLAASGWCIWTRRRSWRIRRDRALSLAIPLQAIGVFLCIPQQGYWLGKIIAHATGIAHLRDYLGHLCFVAALSAVIYACAQRLLPEGEAENYMRRVEFPGALAAGVMLVCLTNSRQLDLHAKGHVFHPDFLDVPLDGWLTTYWLTLYGTSLYLMAHLIRLLLVLRTDPRSRATANLHLAAVAVASLGVFGRLVDVFAGRVVDDAWIWAASLLGCGIATLAAGLSWRGRMRPPPVAYEGAVGD